jgi:photosystem II stability/assembly factor-like uncharacterized protein
MPTFDSGMRARVFVFLLGFCVLGWLIPSSAFLVAPKDAFRVVYKLTAHDTLLDIRLVGDQGWAVGDHGLLLMTLDGGNTWQKLRAPTQNALLGLDMTSAGQGVIVGQGGTILYTADKGRHWTAVETESKARLFSVSLDESGEGLAVGEFGALLRTSDYGRSWKRLTLDWSHLLGIQDVPHLYDVLVENRHTALVVGEFGIVLRTQNAGRNWAVLNRRDESLFVVKRSPNGEYWCLGQSGLLLRSRDRSYKWETINVSQQLGLFDMDMDSHGHGILVGTAGVRETTNSGQTWHSVSTLKLPPGRYYAVTMTREGGYLLAGGSGSITLVKKNCCSDKKPEG